MGASCLHRQIRATSADISGLFEGIRELQNTPIVMMAANDLQADGQAALGESAGDGNGWVTANGDVISGFHPSDVVFHFDAGDFGGEVECLHRTARLG